MTNIVTLSTRSRWYQLGRLLREANEAANLKIVEQLQAEGGNLQ